jgi:hypothetical protein
MTSDIALSVRPKALGRLAHSKSFPSSGASAANPAAAAGAVPLTDPLRNAPARVSYNPATSDQPSAAQLRTNITFAAARRELTGKLPKIIYLWHLRHSLEAFLQLAIVLQQGQALSMASLSLERAAVRGSDGATTRQIVRGLGRCRARNSANPRRTGKGIHITAAQQHRG